MPSASIHWPETFLTGLCVCGSYAPAWLRAMHIWLPRPCTCFFTQPKAMFLTSRPDSQPRRSSLLQSSFVTRSQRSTDMNCPANPSPSPRTPAPTVPLATPSSTSLRLQRPSAPFPSYLARRFWSARFPFSSLASPSPLARRRTAPMAKHLLMVPVAVPPDVAVAAVAAVVVPVADA